MARPTATDWCHTDRCTRHRAGVKNRAASQDHDLPNTPGLATHLSFVLSTRNAAQTAARPLGATEPKGPYGEARPRRWRDVRYCITPFTIPARPKTGRNPCEERLLW